MLSRKFKQYLLTFFIQIIFVSYANGQRRIVGGKKTTIQKYPFLVAIISSGQLFCGGSLVSPSVVLTAAHCCNNTISYTIRAGSSKIYNGGHTAKVIDFEIHPSFHPKTLDYDFCVMYLNRKFPLGKKVTLAKLTSDPYIYAPGKSITAVGWGELTYGGRRPEHVQEVSLQIIPNNDCADNYTSITPIMFCTKTSGKDSCRGDSGGPAIYNGEVIGVVSFGKECASPSYPGVFARVVYALDFILAAIRREA